MKRIATLDIGSNTCILLIAEVDKKNNLKILVDEVRVVRLGQGIDKSNEFHKGALKRFEDCLGEFRKIINQYNPEKILATATSAARDAKNKNLFLEILANYKIPVEIISGDREAELTYLGTISDDSRESIVIDTGGGSTEYIYGSGKNILLKQSLDMGSVRFTERFGEDVNQLQLATDQKLNELQSEFFNMTSESIIGVAGTPVAIACILQNKKFQREAIEGFEIELNDLSSLIIRIKNLSLDDRLKLPGLDAGRADVILAGMVILERSLLRFKKTKLKVSTRGIRFGLAQELSSIDN